MNESLLNQLEEESNRFEVERAAEKEAEAKLQAEAMEEAVGKGEKAGPPSPEYQSQEMKDQGERANNPSPEPKQYQNAFEYLQSGNSIAGNPLESIEDLSLPGQGLADTALDFASGLLPWLKPLDEAYEEMSGRGEQGTAANFVRESSAFVLPTLLTGNFVSGLFGSAAKRLGFASLTTGVAKKAGTVAVDMGVGAGVDAVSDYSLEPGNLSDLLSKHLGIQTPWVHLEGDSPDVTKQKNVAEGAALGGVVGALELALSSNRFTQQIPKIINKIINKKTGKEISFKKGVDSVAATDKARKEAQTAEAVIRFKNDPEGQQGYDPFVNEPHEPQARAVQDVEADPIAFKADNAAIQNNAGTYNGRARPAVTVHFKNDYLEAADASEEGKMLDRLAAELDEVTIETQVGGQKISAEEVEKAVDNLVTAAFNEPEDFIKQFKDLRTATDSILGNKVEYLSEDGMEVATAAYKRFFEMADPARSRASAVLATQTAGNVADAAAAVEKLGQNFDTTRQQELVFSALRILLPEIRKNQFISGKKLQLKQLVKKQKKEKQGLSATWFDDAQRQFTVDLKEKNAETLRFLDQMVDISRENPEYFKPLMREFQKTNGRIDSIEKLARLAENRLGFWKKYFYDGNTEMPSYVIDLLQQTRYNSVLFGMAPIRAAEGAGKALILKPVTTVVGSKIGGDDETFKRALFVYGGIRENIMKAFKVMGDEYRFAVDNPEAAAARGREDFKTSQLGDRETLDELAEAWRKNGEFGKLATWNITKFMTGVQNHWIPRLGINVMTGLDGFTKSLSASFSARSKAYGDLFDATNGAPDVNEFRKLQADLYKQAFDSNGVLTDEVAKKVSGEINLNEDLQMVTALEGFMRHVPVAKSIFLFPRTGLNEMGYVATFSPTGLIGQGLGRARKVMKAQSQFEIDEALLEHGYKTGDNAAFKVLQAEYRGRQIAATGLVMGAALWALDGNLTGAGSYDGAERKRMRDMGQPEFSIRMPGGEWRSYEGMGWVTTFLGLVGSIAYEGQRMDSNITEDWWRALTYAVSMNITNKTFFSSFEPLVKALSGEEGELNRWFAMQIDTQAPFAGLRSMANQAFTPQLKDVENHWFAYLKNRWKHIPAVGDSLVDKVDVYSGEPINYADTMTASINALLPYFNLNPSIEPWREALLRTGWDGLQTPRRNPINNRELTKEQLNYIGTYMGKNFQLGKKVEKLLMNPDGKEMKDVWKQDLKEYAENRGFRGQEAFPINKMRLYELLNELHNEAFNQAWASLERNRADLVNQGILQKITDDKINQGNFKGAADTADNLREDIRQYNSTN